MSNKPEMHIGAWHIIPSANRISGPAGLVDVEPQVMDLLVLLASQPGKTFAKDEIIEALWNSVHVNDDSLTRCVFKLRKALGDDARQPGYIETVSKRGYRLIADVSTPVETTPSKTGLGKWRWYSTAAFVALVVIALIIVNLQPRSEMRDGAGKGKGKGDKKDADSKSDDKKEDKTKSDDKKEDAKADKSDKKSDDKKSDDKKDQ